MSPSSLCFVGKIIYFEIELININYPFPSNLTDEIQPFPRISLFSINLNNLRRGFVVLTRVLYGQSLNYFKNRSIV